jgi:hypothetical protein
MFDLLTAFVAAGSPFDGLIKSITTIVVPVIIAVVSFLAIMRGIKGRFMDMIILILIALVGLVIVLNPDLIMGLAQNTGDSIDVG